MVANCVAFIIQWAGLVLARLPSRYPARLSAPRATAPLAALYGLIAQSPPVPETEAVFTIEPLVFSR